ncbi:branched-chain amino acid ABC transporter permease [Candidatus Spongiihabitans sp.]|uniref:branched-chain amino acid ABC transporter permease n=1 Tax=Candidatus Spongiihabitans sp. TaxID=3101308 RepID=UPI003C7A0582
MSMELLNTLEVILNGLMAGVMYSLVALGFVLIFKASGIFNYAQGVMCLFAALTLVGFQTGQVPFAHLINVIFGTEYHHWSSDITGGMNIFLAIVLTVIVMIGFAYMVERFVLKHLVNQAPIILFMATIGLAFFMEGFGDLMWGVNIKPLDLGIPSGGSFWLEEVTRTWASADSKYIGMYIDVLDIWAAAIAVLLVAVLTLFSQFTKTGRALRAVADDHQAALTLGISLRTIWVIVWSIAGIVALVAGIMWGAKSGVQFSLSLIALKALPVLILGGFTSIPGAIIGGLIIGVGEKLFEFWIGPMVGGATENWFAYVLALFFLMFRPQGLFGEKIIERV